MGYCKSMLCRRSGIGIYVLRGSFKVVGWIVGGWSW